MGIGRVVKCIKNNQNFLITSHTNLEGDALGSELAFYRLLRAKGKNAIIINEDNLPKAYDFLPGTNNIKKFRKSLGNLIFDVFVTLDCSDLKRTGEVYRLNTDNKPVLNIDHHISNRNFGTINWVRPRTSCCAEMIYWLYKKMRVRIDRESALLLYVGILTDTGSFRYSNTSALTHKIAAELLCHNFDIPQIYKYTHENIPLSDMKLLTEVLSAMKYCLGGKIAWFKLTHQILKRQKKISFDLTEHILSFARAIKDVEIAVLFKENFRKNDEIRVNFRSPGKVDVNEIAQAFGGGGHQTASAATIKGKIDIVIRKVLARIKEEIT